MWAVFSRISAPIDALVSRTAAQKLMANSHSMSGRATSTNEPARLTPALLTRIVSRPCFARTASGSAASEAASATSMTCSLTRRPYLRAAVATASSLGPSRSTSARSAPRSAKEVVSAAPIPLAAPVIRAVPPRIGKAIVLVLMAAVPAGEHRPLNVG